MTRKRNPNAANALVSGRVSDVTKRELKKLAKLSGRSLSEVTRLVIEIGLQSAREVLLSRNG